MTTKDLDGFGVPFTDVGATATLYGGAPLGGGGGGWPTRDTGTPPHVPFFVPPAPPVPDLTPRPQGFTLTVTGPDGTVMTLALTPEEWSKVRAAILEAMR